MNSKNLVSLHNSVDQNSYEPRPLNEKIQVTENKNFRRNIYIIIFILLGSLHLVINGLLFFDIYNKFDMMRGTVNTIKVEQEKRTTRVYNLQEHEKGFVKWLDDFEQKNPELCVPRYRDHQYENKVQ